MLFQILGAFAAVISLSVIMSVPKKFLFFTGVVGAIGWSVYLLSLELMNNPVFASFLGAVMIALISHSFARIFKTPVTVFLVSGITPLVPGTGIYKTVYNLIIAEYSLANYYFVYTLQIAGVIAIAILIMDSFFRMLKVKQK